MNDKKIEEGINVKSHNKTLRAAIEIMDNPFQNTVR